MWRHHVYLQTEIVKRKSFLFKDFIYLFLERREEEREGGKHQCVVASYTSPIGDLACNPGMCCPGLGIEPATLWFAGRHSIH